MLAAVSEYVYNDVPGELTAVRECCLPIRDPESVEISVLEVCSEGTNFLEDQVVKEGRRVV